MPISLNFPVKKLDTNYTKSYNLSKYRISLKAVEEGKKRMRVYYDDEVDVLYLKL